ncbi:MAG TPA: TrmJ/YjtD family RNA methyltransferase [Acidisarcina sp.]
MNKSHLENLCVVLVSPRNPLNIGAVARAMSNFGAETLRVVAPYEVAFRDARSAVGAEELLARAELFATVGEAVADCVLVAGTASPGRREALHTVHPLAEAGELIRRSFAAGRVAVLFGSEKRGLLNEDLAHCHLILNIPTRERQPSMNLGQAAAVCLYELAREVGEQKPLEGPASENKAGGGELERLTQVFFEVLQASGYALPQQAAVTEQNLRRLVRRLGLGVRDAESLLGMLRQILWKIRRVGP